MLIPNLKTKFKKSVPLKSYSKKTIKKAVDLELQHIVRGQLLSEDVPVHGYFSQLKVCPRTVTVHSRYVRGQ